MSLLQKVKALFQTSPDQFAAKYLAALRSHGDQRDWHYDKANFQLRQGGPDEEGGMTVNLHTMYQEYCQMGKAQREQQLRNITQMALMQTPETLEAARPDLLPAIKHQAERGLAQLMFAEDHPDQQAWHPLCGNLEIAFIHDTPYAMARLGQQTLDKWSLSPTQFMEIALNNLRQRSDAPMDTIQPGLFVSAWGDYLDASRLLLPDLLYRHPVKGKPVVMVPNRTVLLLTGDQDEAGLTAMAHIAAKVLDDPRPLSAQMMRLDESGWQCFTPPHLAPLLSRLRHQENIRDYGSQKPELEKWLGERGEELFVASYMCWEHESSGQITNVCSWSKGVPTLLPITDQITFVRGEEILMTVGWDEVQRRCGHLMHATDHLPPRYRVDTFPDDALLAELAQVATSEGGITASTAAASPAEVDNQA